MVYHESSFVAVSYGGHLGLLTLKKENQIISLNFLKNEAISLPSNQVVEGKVILSEKNK